MITSRNRPTIDNIFQKIYIHLMYYTCHVYKMKFYNRKQELELIGKIIKAPGPSLVIVKGLRRIGKTRLIIESLNKKEFVNLFVPRNKTTSLFLEETSEELNIPRFNRVVDFLRYLFEKYEFVFIDEFQNFHEMDKSIYSDVQRLFEELKSSNKKCCILVTGSSYSLINKIFSNYANALYGRKDLEINLEELKVTTIAQILTDLGIKDLEQQIKLWSVFGGIPRFYELIEKLSLKSFEEIMRVWYSQSKSIVNEGNSILISEFGSAYKIYYSLMEAIAQGKTKLSEISSVFNNNPTLTNRYLDLIRKEYNLVAKITPITEDIRKSRQGRYIIQNNFLKFWFAFVKRYEAYYEQNRFPELFEMFNKEINSFIGRGFEDFCLQFIKERNILPFSSTRIGKQWGRIIKGEKGKDTYEIDICANNDKTKEIFFGECKWQENVNAHTILNELKDKASCVNWHKGVRKEFFAIFAKSFKDKKVKEEDVYLFDLNDMKRELST